MVSKIRNSAGGAHKNPCQRLESAARRVSPGFGKSQFISESLGPSDTDTNGSFQNNNDCVGPSSRFLDNFILGNVEPSVCTTTLPMMQLQGNHHYLVTHPVVRDIELQHT